ncbi:MAG: YARHG domain-containing protein [Pyrinomonadaceae bacterium]
MPYSPLGFRRLMSAALLIISFLFAANAQDSLDRWNEFDFASDSIKQADIANLELQELKLLRGIIFGRHGRVFKDVAIRKYLAARPWYKANSEYQNSMLNELERRNLDLIRDAEAGKHDQVQPGDMRYYRKRQLTRKQLGNHSKAEWTVLYAEVEAIHGKRFDDQPWLQQYFDERYWYKPSDRYDSKELSTIERKNLQTIAAAQKTQRKLALSPGDMELFENKLISEQMLKGLSLHELRLLRNEVYARHGRQFRAAWLQQYFWSQPWYEQNEDFQDEQLSGSDKQNVETIVKYENRIHDELATKPLTRALLEGLFVEDASKMRQEIYARRGKVFKEPWLAKYFSSFDWYNPDPQFTDSALSEIEKKNIAALLAYEKKAVSAMSVIEG